MSTGSCWSSQPPCAAQFSLSKQRSKSKILSRSYKPRSSAVQILLLAVFASSREISYMRVSHTHSHVRTCNLKVWDLNARALTPTLNYRLKNWCQVHLSFTTTRACEEEAQILAPEIIPPEFVGCPQSKFLQDRIKSSQEVTIPEL